MIWAYIGREKIILFFRIIESRNSIFIQAIRIWDIQISMVNKSSSIFGFNRFSWTKNGLDFNPQNDKSLKTFENSGSFVIPKNKYLAEYKGSYRCYASNKLGVAMSDETHFIVPSELFFHKYHILHFRLHFFVAGLDHKFFFFCYLLQRFTKVSKRKYRASSGKSGRSSGPEM